MSTDTPAPLAFVDPTATDPTYRVTLWAAPGEGKSVAAASAPDPILVLSADRPSAYLFARKHHAGKDIREVRYEGPQTLAQVFAYLKEPDCDIRTVVVDPVSHIVDQLADIAPKARDNDGPDYTWVNKYVLRFVKGLRGFDVNLVLIAHEKVNDGRKGDNKMYPQLGGMGLINKLLAEMDIVAHIERVVRTVDEVDEVLWIGQLQPVGNLVCKESTGVLGDRRVADLSRWFEIARAAYVPDESDLPWGTDPDADARDADVEAQLAADEARAEATA